MSRPALTRKLDGSLRRLGTDRIDLYQAHAWDPLTPVEELLGFFDDATRAALPFLWLYGPDGVGKSSVAVEIFMRVRQEGLSVACVDLDWLGFYGPAPDDDPDNHQLKAANLGALWTNFRRAGSRCVVASGVVEAREDVARYVQALPGVSLTLCRLRADPDTLRERMLRRGRTFGVGTAGAVSGMTMDHLTHRAEQAVEYADELEREDISDFTVDTQGRDVSEVARLVLAGAGDWPNITST